ncbi:hypothetical protein QN277_020419 [Acacia crassicarpa]|uniref:Uncharacterized protein n=1 Tax=Acacia crassicarpa TaxID=499986 RepID=A0AAE1MS37_9FABA|nr:hypothetical protein QN277_020419 [Acacia crassicarpa]
MPSASKRRKAAKKKKVKQAKINPSSDGQQGSDDLKSQDERGSDAGEVSDFGSVGLVKTKVATLVKIDRELKSEESYDGENDKIEYAESAEESNHGNKSPNATSIQEATTSEYLGKSCDPAPAQMTLNTENTPYKEINNSVKTEKSTVSEEKSSDPASSLLEKLVVAKVGAADLGMKRNDDKVCNFSDENAKQKEYASKLPSSSYDSPIPESTNAIENARDSLIPECSEDQPLVASGPPVQKTSWLNCCGLFEVLGSNR